ncbi:glycosyltransferase [Gordonia sp. w5E2]|uniref:glycosyltransferase n=1 Tax=Gordonia TaxID=2053 RepID=UPI0022E2AC92|nr:glycosyltransferase [Gordonia jacobaea]
MTSPRISLVCSTIGRPREFGRLLDSVANSTIAEDVEFIVVDQSDEQECAAMLTSAGLPGPVHPARSPRGVSTGRNAGTQVVTAPVVAYPDDNCWYKPDTLEAVARILDEQPELAGVSGMQVTEDGQPSMQRWLRRPTTVTRLNFPRTSISSTLFFRTEALPSRAPFDESIGVGAPGLRGAGEDSDLVLRLIAAGHSLSYEPSVQILQDDDRHAITEAFVDKMFKYGVGNGHLWRRHRLSLAQFGYHGARKVVGSAVRDVRGDRVHARADLAYLRGELVGYFGRDR